MGVEVLAIGEDSAGHPDIRVLLRELGSRRLTNVLVEGGGQILGDCFDRGVIDEVHAFIAPKLIGGSTSRSPVEGKGLAEMSEAMLLQEPTVETLNGDVYLHGRTAQPVAATKGVVFGR